MIHTLLVANNLLFLYYLGINLIYLILLVAAIYSSSRHQQLLASVRLERMKASPFAPPISLLVPAHNEEANIVESVRSFLALDYPALEVIVVNDGSEDGTLEKLVREFHLLRTDLLYVPVVPSRPVRGLYMSQIEPRLLVVDKEAGGCKADAINAAFNAASSPYVLVLDADSILEQDALIRVMVPILSDPQRVAAAGGIVRAVNGSLVEHGQVRQVRLPGKAVEIVQVVEYLRAFLVGREGWSFFNMLMIISGTFGVFRSDLVKAVGGYRRDAIGEDFDLVTRIHRYMLEQGKDYRVSYVPDPVCWTEVPSDWTTLALQRARWQKGMLNTLWANHDMLFRPRYGRIGALALPNLWLYELLAPVIELLGLSSIIAAAILGVLSHEFFVKFLLFGFFFATLISVGAVLLEEITYRRYNDWREMAKLIVFCFLEHFPYRQMHLYWRLQGLWEYMRGDLAWGKMKRVGFQPAAAGK